MKGFPVPIATRAALTALAALVNGAAPVTLAALGLASIPLSAATAAQTGVGYPQTYSNLTGQILLDNDRVVVQRFVIQPGQSTGIHWHHGQRLLVIIKGGILASKASGRATLWNDGRVFWEGPESSADEGSTNIGKAPITLIWVAIKPVVAMGTAAATAAGTTVAASAPAATADQSSEYQYLDYPNVPGEDLLENERVIVQRFALNPGQWEGVHAHPPDSLYIFVKGSRWVSRSYQQSQTASGDSPDGSVGWMPAIGIRAGHESGNVGNQPSEVVWVTLKK